MVASCLQLNVCCLDLFWDLYFPILYIAKLSQVFPWHTLYTCTSMMTTAKCTSMSPSVILQQWYRASLTCCSSTKCRLVSRGLALVVTVGTCRRTPSIHVFLATTSAFSRFIASSCSLHCCNSLLFGTSYSGIWKMQAIKKTSTCLITGASQCDHISPILHCSSCQLHGINTHNCTNWRRE